MELVTVLTMEARRDCFLTSNLESSLGGMTFVFTSLTFSIRRWSLITLTVEGLFLDSSLSNSSWSSLVFSDLVTKEVSTQMPLPFSPFHLSRSFRSWGSWEGSKSSYGRSLRVSLSLYILSMHWSSVSPIRQASLRKVVMETPPSGLYETRTLLRVGIWAEANRGSEKERRKSDDIILCLRLSILWFILSYYLIGRRWP